MFYFHTLVYHNSCSDNASRPSLMLFIHVALEAARTPVLLTVMYVSNKLAQTRSQILSWYKIKRGLGNNGFSLAQWQIALYVIFGPWTIHKYGNSNLPTGFSYCSILLLVLRKEFTFMLQSCLPLPSMRCVDSIGLDWTHFVHVSQIRCFHNSIGEET